MKPCACANTTQDNLTTPKGTETSGQSGNNYKYAIKYWAMAALFVGFWTLLYVSILPVAKWMTYDILQLANISSLAGAVEFFLYDTVKILLLLVMMVYIIAWLRAAINVERIRDYLKGKGRGLGYGLGSIFGAVTPFCSCSSIPLFLAFSNARIPLGVTMSFLITSPLINEIAIVLLWGLLGWKFTLTYIIVGLLAGIIGGIVMDLIGAERWLKPFGKAPQVALQPLTITPKNRPKMTLKQRHDFAREETQKVFQKVWLWVIIGVALGAILHGYVPEEWFAQNLGAGQWWSVPLAVLVGIPLYTNVTGIIPIMESLLMKGLPLGTTLAFCMSAVAASLPEILMLKQVMKWQLLAVFIGTLLVIFTLIGWLFNIFPF